MKLKTILLLAVAVGCGLVAMFGVQSMSGGTSAEVEEKVSVLMALADIEVGEQLTPENVSFREVSVETAPENSVLKEEEYQDRSAVVKILANDFITLPKLSEPGVWGRSVAIPKGWRVETVTVNDNTTHSGMLAAGDRVDVMVTYQSRSALGQTTQTKVLLEFIEVFATGNKTASDSSKDSEQKIKNVSLLVTPDQAPYLKLAEKKGTLSLSWRGRDDDELVNVGAVDEKLMQELQGTLDKDQHGMPSYSMFGQHDPEDGDAQQPGLAGWIDEQKQATAEAEAAAAAAAAQQANQLAAVDPTKPMWKMEIFHGDERLLVEMELPEDETAESTDPKTEAEGAEDTPAQSTETEPVSTEAGGKGVQWKSLLKGLNIGT
jgi:pilus assembly protein CpaB